MMDIKNNPTPVTSLDQKTPIERLTAISCLLHSQKETVDILSKLCPLSTISWEEISNNEGSKKGIHDLFSRHLSTLYAVDCAFEKFLGYAHHIYILGDKTIPLLWDNSSSTNHMDNLYIPELLSTSGMIYRFNVAKKFGYEINGLMQLRLNGWGRHAIEQFEIINTIIYKEIKSNVEHKINENIESYKELIGLLSAPHRPLQTDRIHYLNKNVAFPIVS